MTNRGGQPIGKRLSAIARSLNKSQVDLSIAVGISVSQLSRFFSGNTEIKSEKLVQLLSELGIDLEDQIDRKIVKSGGLSLNTNESIGALVDELSQTIKPHKRRALTEFIVAYGAHNGNERLSKRFKKMEIK